MDGINTGNLGRTTETLPGDEWVVKSPHVESEATVYALQRRPAMRVRQAARDIQSSLSELLEAGRDLKAFVKLFNALTNTRKAAPDEEILWKYNDAAITIGDLRKAVLFAAILGKWEPK